MNSIWGWYRTDSAPILTKPYDIMDFAEPGYNSVQTCSMTNVSFGCHGRYASIEEYPTSSPTCWIVFEGILDNRDKLIKRLLGGGECFQKSDASIALAAYTKWGLEFLDKLIGVFSLAVWDAARNQFFFVRDPLGIRGLFYHWDGYRLIFASNFKQMLTVQNLGFEYDQKYIGDCLVGINTDGKLTPYKKINRLPRASMITVENSDLRERRYWNIGTLGNKRVSDVEYIERFRELFKASVDSCLQRSDKVGILLSGGLDSSAIFGMASEIVGAEGKSRPLPNFSLVYDENPECDERVFIKDALEAVNATGNFVIADNYWFLQNWEVSMSEAEEPSGVFVDQPFRALFEKARSLGVDTVLHGLGGDELLAPAMCYLSDFLRAGNIHRLMRELLAWRQSKDMLTLICYDVFLPLLPFRLIQRLREIRRAHKRGDFQMDLVPSWIEPSFTECLNLEDRIRGAIPDPRFRSASLHVDYVATLCNPAPHWLVRDIATPVGIEVRYPFLNLDFIKFCLALPTELKMRQATSKWILRQALKDLLPKSIHERRGKPSSAILIRKGIKREWPRINQCLKAHRDVYSDYVCYDRFSEVMESIIDDLSLRPGRLITTLQVLLWLVGQSGKAEIPSLLQS